VRLDWLSAVCRSEGPFATVVLDISHNTEDADHRAEVRRKDVHERLAAQGAPAAVVDRVDAIDFKGADCEQATKYLEEALGTVGQRARKPEFHQHRRRQVRRLCIRFVQGTFRR